jgi:hypothetical protein
MLLPACNDRKVSVSEARAAPIEGFDLRLLINLWVWHWPVAFVEKNVRESTSVSLPRLTVVSWLPG